MFDLRFHSNRTETCNKRWSLIHVIEMQSLVFSLVNFLLEVRVDWPNIWMVIIVICSTALLDQMRNLLFVSICLIFWGDFSSLPSVAITAWAGLWPNWAELWPNWAELWPNWAEWVALHFSCYAYTGCFVWGLKPPITEKYHQWRSLCRCEGGVSCSCVFVTMRMTKWFIHS